MSVQVRPVAPIYKRMRTPKNLFLENILSHEECDTLNYKYLNHIQNGWKGYGYDSRTKGISLSSPSKVLDIDDSLIVKRLTESIEANFTEKLEYSHSFLRFYKNDSHLLLHTDRKGLDITLTVNIGGLENWPIHISNVYTDESIDLAFSDDQSVGLKYKEDYSSFLIPKGCGVACYAKNFPHWREKLVCNDNEYVLQIFYHWTIVD